MGCQRGKPAVDNELLLLHRDAATHLRSNLKFELCDKHSTNSAQHSVAHSVFDPNLHRFLFLACNTSGSELFGVSLASVYIDCI